MAEENNDANSDTSTESGEVESAGSSPDVGTGIEDADGFVSTTEFKPAEATEAKPEDADTSEKTEQKTETIESKDKGFADHPDWQKMVGQKNQFKETAEKVPALEKRLAELENRKPEPKESKPFKSIFSMDSEALVEEFSRNPKSVFAALAQEVEMEADRKAGLKVEQANAEKLAKDQKTFEDAKKGSWEKFFKKRDDGIKMLEDGRIGKYMTDAPGSTPIEAYYALTEGPNNETAIKEAVEKAVKETTDKIYSTFKAKGIPVDGTTATKSLAEKSAEEKNPENFGGAKAVAIRRSRQRATA